jgi:hypothetical protein
MLGFHLLIIIALISPLAPAAPTTSTAAPEPTNCTARCSETDDQGRTLVSANDGLLHIHLLWCEWQDDSTTQYGNYYADTAVRIFS